MLTERFGISVHQHRGAWPRKDEQERLGITALRVLVVDQDLLVHQLKTDLADGVKVIALVNSQTPDVNLDPANPHGLAGWETAIAKFAKDFEGLVHAVECLNEWDIGPKNTIEEVVRCAVTASPILRAKGIKSLLGSVAGATWLTALKAAVKKADDDGVRGTLDGVCTHPYLRPALGVPDPEPATGAWMPPELDAAIQLAFDAVNSDDRLPRLPVYVTEYGLPMDPADDGEVQQQFVTNSLRVLSRLSDEVLGAACYYSYSDRSVSSPPVFGLVRRDETPRLGLTAFANEVNGVSPVFAEAPHDAQDPD